MRAGSEIVRIPKLPRVPPPPEAGRDERQGTFEGIAGRLGDAMGDRMAISAANTSRGFPASRVDLGRLQAGLEEGLKRFDMKVVRSRWDVDVAGWMTRLLTSWVQRSEGIRFRLARIGVHVRLETQDDRVCCRHELDVFPGRGGGSTRGLRWGSGPALSRPGLPLASAADPLDPGHAVEAAVEAQDPLHAAACHDGDVEGVAGREARSAREDLCRLLDVRALDGKDLVDDSEKGVESRPDGVATVDRDVAVEDLLQDLGARHEPIAARDGLFEVGSGGRLQGMRRPHEVHRHVRVDEDQAGPR